MVKTRNQLLLLGLRADKDESQREEKFCKDSPISAPELVQYQIITQNTKKTKKENHEMKNKDNNNNNKKKKLLMTTSAHFIGSPFSPIEAVARWPHRYSSCHNSDIKSESFRVGKQMAMKMVNDYIVFECKAHYARAEVDGCTYDLDDYVTINCDQDIEYAGQIGEFFETTNKECWLALKWMFRPEDTAIGMDQGKNHDKRRLFHSNESDVIPLETITSKIKVLQVSPSFCRKRKISTRCDFYYDMGYSYDYSTFYCLNSVCSGSSASRIENPHNSCKRYVTRSLSKQKMSNKDITITKSSMEICAGSNKRITRSQKSISCSATTCIEMATDQENRRRSKTQSQDCAGLSGIASVNTDLSLLDIYSGCGGLSTGLCMGACLSGISIVTRWAIDINECACESFKLNHPQTEVRNEAAEDFLSLIKEWKRLCDKYSDTNIEPEFDDDEETNVISSNENGSNESQEYEVAKINGIRWLGPTNGRKKGLEFKIHWKGYPEEEDSWEPLHALKNCMRCLKDFVLEGIKRKILPLPGHVDVICGGPPCQGITGLNRFRNANAPLEDPKNQQTVVFMDIVEFLKPRFVILENVVDILRFSNGFLGRYAISRIVQMHYQARLGLLVAGCYGLPQFRMRFFLVAASPFEILPAFPLPTHDVLLRGTKPSEWERNIVAYNENSQPKLNDAVLLQDAISDLPPVTNVEKREQMPYAKPPLTPFQKFMRSPLGANTINRTPKLVQDHRPLVLNNDNFERMCRIPKRKGANFTDLPGLKKLRDGTLELDPKKMIVLSSGKRLVPKYALNHFQANSTKPFGRLWWDEIVPTLTTRPTPYARATIHPTQDRVLSIRECARVQGFPDDYKFSGPVKERYRQIGNAVALPVAKALGYSLGLAMKKNEQNANKAEFELPLDFAFKSPNANSSLEANTFPRRNLRPRKL